MFRGMIFGMMMTVGGVYAADSMVSGGMRPMVNWDVAFARSADAASFLREELVRLIDHARATSSAIAPTATSASPSSGATAHTSSIAGCAAAVARLEATRAGSSDLKGNTARLTWRA